MTEHFAPSSWSEYALCYDSLNALTPYRELIADVVEALMLTDSDIVLDACCGTGNLLAHLARSTPGASYTGVDFSPAMLDRARTKSTVRLVEADLTERIPFGDGIFSKLSCVNGLYTMPDTQVFLAECNRVLATGGAAVFVTPRKGFENGLILKAHSKSTLPDEHWANAHESPERERALITEAIDDPEIVRQMLTVAHHNRAIVGTRSFTFFSEQELRTAVVKAGFTVRTCRPAYASQGILIVVTKE